MLDDTRGARREATRARILDAAWARARREGLASVTLRDLAADVGMRAPSLYSYFESKNALYDAMFAAGVTDLGAELARRDGPDPRARFRDRIHRFVRWCAADASRYQLIFQRTIPGFEPSPESFQLTVATLGATRQEASEAGLTDDADFDLLRATLNGIIAQQTANEPGGDRWLRLVDRALDLFLPEPPTTRPTRPNNRGSRP